MATVAETLGFKELRPDQLSGTPRAHAIDRWIFVFNVVEEMSAKEAAAAAKRADRERRAAADAAGPAPS